MEWLPRWLQPKAPVSVAVRFDGQALHPRLIRHAAQVTEADAHRLATAWRERLLRALPRRTVRSEA